MYLQQINNQVTRSKVKEPHFEHNSNIAMKNMINSVFIIYSFELCFEWTSKEMNRA